MAFLGQKNFLEWPPLSRALHHASSLDLLPPRATYGIIPHFAQSVQVFVPKKQWLIAGLSSGNPLPPVSGFRY